MNQTDVTAPEPGSRIRFAARDWLALGMALGLSLLWFSVFGLDKLFAGDLALPALGAAAFTASLWACVLLYLGREARWNAYNAALAAGVGLLTLCCVIYGDLSVRLINFLLIACGSALCFFSLSGSAKNSLLQARVAAETLALTFIALFSNCFKPFRALGSLSGDGKKTAGLTLLGLFCAGLLLALVIPLLSSADAVFGSLFTGLWGWLDKIDAATALWLTLRTAVLTLLLFSAVYFLRHTPERAGSGGEKRPAPAAPFVAALFLLNAVYAVFAAIQFAFLFGGAETAAMGGGYAEYARSGFFQLVRVAAINLAVVLVCAVYADRKLLLNIMSTFLLLMTAVILLSAFWRMRLYISVYGLSLLRAMTLWAMAFIALCLILASLRIWKPGFRFWPFFAALGLAGWIAFNLVNIDARIADYNVDAYLDGRLEDVDIYYLSTLSPDVLPALERLRESEGGDYAGQGESDFYLSCDLDDAIDNARDRYFAPAHWSQWSLSWSRYQ